ncbi:hypothetical protein [Burkholderia ubonensis]|uniref:hypothetical protein n=1 Tax=Burkholderia ubonensis TaxID=101571 RepID=UPI000B095658|nr:hypothetical protein [Burkholderia ubonensis]
MELSDDFFAELICALTSKDISQIQRALQFGLTTTLGSKFEDGEWQIYLLSYEFGFAENIYGSSSAICAGIKRGLTDAIFTSTSSLSNLLILQAEQLGKKHGALVRSICVNDI